MKKWTTAMDDSDPHDDGYPHVPWPEEAHPQNCRCILPEMEVPWVIEVSWIMDEIFGNTSPRLPEYDDG
jgi:hypothetical protein